MAKRTKLMVLGAGTDRVAPRYTRQNLDSSRLPAPRVLGIMARTRAVLPPAQRSLLRSQITLSRSPLSNSRWCSTTTWGRSGDREGMLLVAPSEAEARVVLSRGDCGEEDGGGGDAGMFSCAPRVELSYEPRYQR